MGRKNSEREKQAAVEEGAAEESASQEQQAAAELPAREDVERACQVVADALERESVIGGPQGQAYFNASRIVRGLVPTTRSVGE